MLGTVHIIMYVHFWACLFSIVVMLLYMYKETWSFGRCGSTNMYMWQYSSLELVTDRNVETVTGSFSSWKHLERYMYSTYMYMYKKEELTILIKEKDCTFVHLLCILLPLKVHCHAHCNVCACTLVLSKQVVNNSGGWYQ